MTFILRILVIDKVTASVHEEIIVEEQHLARLLHKFKDQITFQSCFVKRLHCCFINRCEPGYMVEPLRTSYVRKHRKTGHTLAGLFKNLGAKIGLLPFAFLSSPIEIEFSIEQMLSRG